MKNKTLWKQVGAAAIAAAMVMSTVPATPVQAAGGKTLAVSSQKQLNQALKTVKGKNAVITVKAGKNVKITIPKGTYKVTIRVVGKKAAVVNNGTVKEIVVNSKGTNSLKKSTLLLIRSRNSGKEICKILSQKNFMYSFFSQLLQCFLQKQCSISTMLVPFCNTANGNPCCIRIQLLIP